MKFPIICNHDWVQLIWVEADNREEALVSAATNWIKTMKEDNPDYEIWLDPKGITGSTTPSCELRTLTKSTDGSEIEDATWISPHYESD